MNNLNSIDIRMLWIWHCVWEFSTFRLKTEVHSVRRRTNNGRRTEPNKYLRGALSLRNPYGIRGPLPSGYQAFPHLYGPAGYWPLFVPPLGPTTSMDIQLIHRSRWSASLLWILYLLKLELHCLLKPMIYANSLQCYLCQYFLDIFYFCDYLYLESIMSWLSFQSFAGRSYID